MRYRICFEDPIGKIKRRNVLKSAVFQSARSIFLIKQIICKLLSGFFLIDSKRENSIWYHDSVSLCCVRNISGTAERTVARDLRGTIDYFSTAVGTYKELALISPICIWLDGIWIIGYALNCSFLNRTVSYTLVLSAKRTEHFSLFCIISKGSAAVRTFAVRFRHGGCF